MNTDKIKVLIGDNTADYGIKTASKLREFGLFAYTRKCDGQVIFEAIQKDLPDVVVVDLTLPNLDSLELIKKTNEINSRHHTNFIITSDIQNSFIERQVMENGAAYFLTKPFEPENLCSIIKSITRKNVSDECTDIEIIVTDIIHRLGVPAHIKGYHYLRTAILEAAQNLHLMDCITKRLYPLVAQKYDTTPSRVERAIRHAIEIAWERGDADTLTSFFGYTINAYRGKPTNSEFIALITDKLLLQQKSAYSVNRKQEIWCGLAV